MSSTVGSVATADVSHQRRDRGIGLALLGGALAVMMVGALAATNPARLDMIDRFADHPSLYALVVISLLAGAVPLLVTRTWIRVTSWIVLAVVGALVLVAVLFVVLEGPPERESVTSPDGTRDLVVERRYPTLLTQERVLVVTRKGPLSRATTVAKACTAALDVVERVTSATWDGNDAVVLVIDDRQERISLDPRTGEPDRTIDTGCL